MANRTESDGQISGLGVPVGILAYALVLVAAPSVYFGYVSESKAALVFYIVAIVPLLIGIGGLLLEVSKREVSTFLRELFTGMLPEGVWGSPNRHVLVNAGITVFLLLPGVLLHLIAISLIEVTGVVEVVVRVIVLGLFALPTFGLASVLDELAIKPLVLIPAARLEAFYKGYSATGGNPRGRPAPSRSSAASEQPGPRTSWFAVWRGLSMIVWVGGFIQALTAIGAVVGSIIRAL